MARYCLFTFVVLLTLTLNAKAQVITDPVLAGLIKKQNNFFTAQIPEKIYIQTDKPNYTIGDTMRLKAYLLDAVYLTPTNRSGILYVELGDEEGKAAKRIMLPVIDGQAWCDVALDEKDVPQGGYSLRAYTNWMRNFGEDYIFKKSIYISPAGGNAALVKANFTRQDNKIEAALLFSTLDDKILRLRDMELKVMEGRKTLSKDRLITGMDGTVKVSFELPPATGKSPGHISIQAKDVTKGPTNGATLTIPLILNRPQSIDVQFMPEGGNLVAGIATRVGLKAIGEDGKGVIITGKILNSTQQEVATFNTTYAGMGSFEFIPTVNEVYTAKVNGIDKSYPLPLISAIGTVLNIQPGASNDSLYVTLTASAELTGARKAYYLIGRARGVVCYAQVINFNNGQAVKKKVASALFPTGIARFTLHDSANVPLNERQVFIDHYDGLRISISNQIPKYGIRDSIALAIEVKDKDNKPMQGIFSLAITDDDQVKTDSLGSNIYNNLLLTSDLKGNIENAGYYFIKPSKQKQTELDNLMLTQGWIGYDWKDVFAPARPLVYQPEKEFVVRGRATNAFGKPIENSKVVMLLNRSSAVRDTLTDNLGRFVFNGLLPLDSAVINLQARNKRGREFNVGLEVDEFIAPVFKKQPLQAPWYLNTDTTLLKNAQAKVAQAKAAAEYNGEGMTLREVVIKDKRIIKDSKNLNGPEGADIILEEEFFQKAGHKNLEELLRARFGNQFQVDINALYGNTYRFKQNYIVLYIDGVNIARTGQRVQDFMTFLSAEDIKGVEVMNSSKYAMAYVPNYISLKARFPEKRVPVVLEITTYSGGGAYLKKTPGTYLYRPIPFTLPAQFYSPKYTVKNKSIALGTDLRSTLHWEPNVITDAEGKATVSFYMADKAANYTVIMEGFTGQGEVGHSRHTIKSAAGK